VPRRRKVAPGYCDMAARGLVGRACRATCAGGGRRLAGRARAGRNCASGGIPRARGPGFATLMESTKAWPRIS